MNAFVLEHLVNNAAIGVLMTFGGFLGGYYGVKMRAPVRPGVE